MAAVDRVARLQVRVLGDGPPVVVVHGGPDFDHEYLRPELDDLAGPPRLIYYDQRGRGRSGAGMAAADISIRSEIEDLDAVRERFAGPSLGILGHSWGGVLAMMYAIRHPNRVSHLILMNSAPACRDDWLRLREELRRGRSQQDAETMSALSRTAAYQRGDLEAEADYYRAHFRATLPSPDLLERVIARLRKNFTPEGVLLARAIEQRLYQQTWMTPGFDLLPALRALDVPTLVIHGEQDLIPLDAAAHIAKAVPGARLRILARCGHFAYIERLDAIRFEVQSLLSAD